MPCEPNTEGLTLIIMWNIWLCFLRWSVASAVSVIPLISHSIQTLKSNTLSHVILCLLRMNIYECIVLRSKTGYLKTCPVSYFLLNFSQHLETPPNNVMFEGHWQKCCHFVLKSEPHLTNFFIFLIVFVVIIFI